MSHSKLPSSRLCARPSQWGWPVGHASRRKRCSIGWRPSISLWLRDKPDAAGVPRQIDQQTMGNLADVSAGRLNAAHNLTMGQQLCPDRFGQIEADVGPIVVEKSAVVVQKITPLKSF